MYIKFYSHNIGSMKFIVRVIIFIVIIVITTVDPTPWPRVLHSFAQCNCGYAQWLCIVETKSKFPVLCTGIVSSCAQFAYFVEMCNYTKCAQVENRAVGAVVQYILPTCYVHCVSPTCYVQYTPPTCYVQYTT